VCICDVSSFGLVQALMLKVHRSAHVYVCVKVVCVFIGFQLGKHIVRH